MTQQVTPFDATARRHMADGLKRVVDAAKTTLGPRGKRVAVVPTAPEGIESTDTEIRLQKHFETVGAQMARDVVAVTSAAVGDGTTTALVLMQRMFVAGSELVNAGSDPTGIKRGIDRAVMLVVGELELLSTSAETRNRLVQVATTSADGDEAVGNLIADAVARVGTAGIVILQGSGPECTLEFVAGTRFQQGYLSHYFVTDSERREAVLDDAYVLIHVGELADVRALLPLLEQVAKAGRPLLVIAEIASEALATLVSNKVKGTIEVCVVNPPGRDDQRGETLRDLALRLGGRAVARVADPSVAAWTLEDLGQAKTVIVTRDSTTLLQGAGSERNIAPQLGQLRLRLEAATSAEERTLVGERLARANGVAVVRVGAQAESQPNWKRGRVESAVRATHAAIEEGIVPGGGVALLRTLPALAQLTLPATEQCGVAIVSRALEEPLRQLAENGGLAVSAVVNEVRAGQGPLGYNAFTGEYEDLVAAGVVDATKVVCVALQSAAAVATATLIAEPLIAEPGVNTSGARASP